jgi:predicted NACHT family NTPase
LAKPRDLGAFALRAKATAGLIYSWQVPKLHLFLDSLDEGLLSIKILVRILKREIEQLPCDRLYFRITCRTADWKDSLEQKLKDKWGEKNVAVYELAPLCRVDVIEAGNKAKLLRSLIV